MSIWNDLRYSARMLLREPGFATVAILTVALGVGANTAIFSIVNGVLLRPLLYADPDRLVALREVVPAMAQTYPTLPVSARHFTEWRQRATAFERLSAVQTGAATLTGAGEPEQLDIARVSADLFDTLGVKPVLGRAFAAGEDQAGRDAVAVISDSLWRRRFHADHAILGSAIQLDSRPHTVIGVLPPWFRFPSARVLDVGQVSSLKPEVFRPLVFQDDELKELMGNFNYTVIARLKRGLPPDRPVAELNVIAAQLVKLSGAKTELRAMVIPMRDSIVGKSRRGLWLLLAAVGAVLLIGCVNLANLLLARSEGAPGMRPFVPRSAPLAAGWCARPSPRPYYWRSPAERWAWPSRRPVLAPSSTVRPRTSRASMRCGLISGCSCSPWPSPPLPDCCSVWRRHGELRASIRWTP